MSKFDELQTIKRIIMLYRERGFERTEDDVRKYAAVLAKQNRITLRKALEAIGEDLLASNPKPERWD